MVDDVVSWLGPGWFDAAGIVRKPAQPMHLRLAQKVVLPLPREEIVAEHHSVSPESAEVIVANCPLMIVAVAIARIGAELSGGHECRDQQSPGDDEEFNHRSAPFV